MGSATARALAGRGRRVLLLERFRIGHDRGSSHGPSRIFRFSYHEPAYVRMAMDALRLWRELEDESGEALLTATGGLDLGAMVPYHAAALEEAGAAFEHLPAAKVMDRFGVTVPGDALFQPDAATVAADRAWRALAAGAARAGAEVREDAGVSRVEPANGGVAVTLESGERIEAGVAVVAAGAWARPLLAHAGIDLPVRPTRETVAYFPVPEPDRAPAIVDWDAPAIYALRSPGEGIKAGRHQAGPEIDPDRAGEPDPDSVERVGAWIRERFPGADGIATRAETCLYTNTDDGRFLLERHRRIVVGSPCSGHGFKFAPLIGERLADLALEAV
jgi:sarcosine oxidase